jgi:hypothetical protein
MGIKAIMIIINFTTQMIEMDRSVRVTPNHVWAVTRDVSLYQIYAFRMHKCATGKLNDGGHCKRKGVIPQTGFAASAAAGSLRCAQDDGVWCGGS